MTRFLIYLFPAMFDMVLTCALLTSQMRMAATQMPAVATTGITAVWAITYTLACLWVGRRVRPGNAARMIVAGGLVAAAGAAGFLVFPNPVWMYLFIAVVSVGCALFFVPFQVFMKAVDQEHHSPSIARATALYTLSWSSGAAAGPFVAGVVWSATGTWQYGYAFCGVTAVVVSGGVLALRSFTRKRQSALENPPPLLRKETAISKPSYKNMPDLAWLGWVGSGAGILCFFLIQGLFPVTARHGALPKAQQGMVIALMLLTQALTGFFLGFGRRWMYRRGLLAVFGGFGAAGLMLYAWGQSVELFFLAAGCFGLYSGSFFFYLVFHAIVHPDHSARYVSVNEAIVGVCGFVGPMAGGLLADGLGISKPYLMAVGVIVAGVLLKLIVHTRFRPNLQNLGKG